MVFSCYNTQYIISNQTINMSNTVKNTLCVVCGYPILIQTKSRLELSKKFNKNSKMCVCTKSTIKPKIIIQENILIETKNSKLELNSENLVNNGVELNILENNSSLVDFYIHDFITTPSLVNQTTTQPPINVIPADEALVFTEVVNDCNVDIVPEYSDVSDVEEAMVFTEANITSVEQQNQLMSIVGGIDDFDVEILVQSKIEEQQLKIINIKNIQNDLKNLKKRLCSADQYMIDLHCTIVTAQKSLSKNLSVLCEQQLELVKLHNEKLEILTNIAEKVKLLKEFVDNE